MPENKYPKYLKPSDPKVQEFLAYLGVNPDSHNVTIYIDAIMQTISVEETFAVISQDRKQE